MVKSQTLKKVGLLLDATDYGRGILRGIYRFVLPHKSWAVRRFDLALASVSTLAHWNADGIVAHMGTARLADAVRSLGRPVVDVAGNLRDPGVCQVRTDDFAVGEGAAEHLWNQGLRNLAYFSNIDVDFSSCRRDGFIGYFNRRGLEPLVLDRRTPRAEFPLTKEGAAYDKAVVDWLVRLPKPAGILACDDGMSLELAEFCRIAGLRVPDDVSLIGVDNDELFCNLGSPPLTSVQQPLEEIGFEAARLLDALMRGIRPRGRFIRLAPLRVVMRHSTSVLSVQDDHLAKAILYIRQHVSDQVTVDDVLRVTPVSRRSLEQRFRRILGRSPMAEIMASRIERARQLLAATDLKLPAVAAAAGFRNAQRLCRAFKRATGLRPGEYRRQFHAR